MKSDLFSFISSCNKMMPLLIRYEDSIERPNLSHEAQPPPIANTTHNPHHKHNLALEKKEMFPIKGNLKCEVIVNIFLQRYKRSSKSTEPNFCCGWSPFFIFDPIQTLLRSDEELHQVGKKSRLIFFSTDTGQCFILCP